jgi:hypothetical protein
MGGAMVQGVCHFVNCVNLSHLRRVWCGRQGQIGIAPRLCEYLKLLIHTTETATGRVSQRPIAMDERIARRPLAVFLSETSVSRQDIPELDEHAPGITGTIRRLYTMVEVDLDLTPPSPAMLGKAVNQALIVVFGRVKVRMA